MKALNDIIIVKRRKANSVIEIVGHKEHIGEVIASGPGKTQVVNGKTVFIPNQVKVGHHIMFSQRAGMEANIEGQDVLVMREPDVLCFLENPDEIKLTDNAADEKRDVVGVFDVGGV